jgi:hypothetical protein
MLVLKKTVWRSRYPVPHWLTPRTSMPTATADRLTLADAAAKCRVSERTVARRIADGTLPCERVAGRIYIRENDLSRIPQGALAAASEEALIDELVDALRVAGLAIPSEARDLRSIRVAVLAVAGSSGSDATTSPTRTSS